MIVKKCEVVKVEAIVRGYITGSAWAEYKKSQTVHGIPMPAGLVESQKLPKPIFTPSTKAEQGEHDENIHPDKVKDICGPQLAGEIERIALQLYTEAAAYALTRGLILADTKFEFGLLPSASGSKELILIDELLTPDSSRYWAAADWEEGKPQASFDKQYLRDWLISTGQRNKPNVTLPDNVLSETRRKYEEAKDRVMGLGQWGVHGKPSVKGSSTVLQTDQVTDAVRGEAGKPSGTATHGNPNVKGGDETVLQTDQVTDAVRGEAQQAPRGKVHGNSNLQAGNALLQTDQAADAIVKEASTTSKTGGVHGKSEVQAGDEAVLQTDQATDAIRSAVRGQ